MLWIFFIAHGQRAKLVDGKRLSGSVFIIELCPVCQISATKSLNQLILTVWSSCENALLALKFPTETVSAFPVIQFLQKANVCAILSSIYTDKIDAR